ncbi:Cell adhesion molecule-related/down-regulated by oncogene [Dissostichus eleginoides]|uniref:Cell adhesion molecule-related/down-regulated by oncogene n=1 Tax=Dissostichus eleginoides TaxID=100907 RepID=A0AAD9C7J3_DISEL|nr:Cell adhesion molecule-related/down-regulated by oncogene [Dissostichus eleginoides]
MNILLTSSLLGVAAVVLQAATAAETLKVSVSVWPPGSNVYLGECVLLQCSVESNSSFVWSYGWLKHSPHADPPTPNPRHLVLGDSYSITAVTREDAGSYQCQARRWDSNSSSVEFLSQTATLSVSELPSASLLTLTPSTRQFFREERFTVQCPVSQINSSGWRLKHFPPISGVRPRVSHTDPYSLPGGAVSAGRSDRCEFTADSGNSGLYWCQGAEGRSNAVYIKVSYGAIILKTPAFPVFEDRVIQMTLENVTQEDEGFYKCASQDRKMESPEAWLSVSPHRGNFTSTDERAASNSGSGKWVIVSCGVLLLFFIPVTVWLLHHYRFCTCRCWPFSKERLQAVELPATKQDVTEVQWDLSWMEMSNLLDKQLFPGT